MCRLLPFASVSSLMTAIANLEYCTGQLNLTKTHHPSQTITNRKCTPVKRKSTLEKQPQSKPNGWTITARRCTVTAKWCDHMSHMSAIRCLFLMHYSPEVRPSVSPGRTSLEVEKSVSPGQRSKRASQIMSTPDGRRSHHPTARTL